MMNYKQLLAVLLLSFSFLLQAEEAENASQTEGYIADNLHIFMHSGAGKNYRILGSINAGEKITITGNTNNNFTEVITDKGRTGWIESQYASTTPGLRYVIADLNEQLAMAETDNQKLTDALNASDSKINQLQAEQGDLEQRITSLTSNLTQVQSQLKNQDTAIKKEWFFNGAIVLGLGLLLGLIIPKLFARKRSSMSSWN